MRRSSSTARSGAGLLLVYAITLALVVNLAFTTGLATSGRLPDRPLRTSVFTALANGQLGKVSEPVAVSEAAPAQPALVPPTALAPIPVAAIGGAPSAPQPAVRPTQQLPGEAKPPAKPKVPDSGHRR